MKLRFFTNVSHEFRTPLTLIMTPLEKLMKTEKDLESQQILKLIYRNADRLLKLVNQLLDFRKIDMQGDSLVLSTGDIVPFVRDVAYSFKELFDRRFHGVADLLIFLGHQQIDIGDIVWRLSLYFLPRSG